MARMGQKGWIGAGGWLFKHRTAIPVPIALALLLIPSTNSSGVWIGAGALTIAAGELLRLMAVRQIGAISRTRSDRLGPLVAAGPFAYVRNPLYLGNIALWLGFALLAGLPWLVLPVGLLLALEYHAIVRWEEQLLEARLGNVYRDYAARVPRWVPRLSAPVETSTPSSFSWRATFFSERGTLIAIAAGLALLWLKRMFG
jgi:protein-S-isoprenylcysteine O-methyltransferase Ste14